MILAATAGDVDTGAFDPSARWPSWPRRYGAWLHVDGAFGLFAGASPVSAHLVDGIDGAHSVIADGHKWLNVPYDCGFAFVRDPQLLGRTFAAGAAYLPKVDDPRPSFGYQGPEMSRRARALPVWATLAAYGRQGYREMVERHLALASQPGSTGGCGARARASRRGAPRHRVLPLSRRRPRRGRPGRRSIGCWVPACSTTVASTWARRCIGAWSVSGPRS